ncbi:U32 family peptidase [Schinkia sp. CFF1]
MKILAPISRADEVEMLAENGAEEFYCGLLPTGWMAQFSGGVWTNRRNPLASLSTYEEFEKLVDRAHSYGIPVFITLNSPYYTVDEIPILLEMIKEAIAIGADAFVISDIGLLKKVRNQFPSIDLHVSSLATPINSYSVQLFRELGANRIVFPRSLHLNEIRNIIEIGGPDMEYEVFILNDGCVYEEGNCFTSHQLGAFCSTENWQFQWHSSYGEKQLSKREEEILGEHLQDYREFVWFTNSCGCSLSDEGLPLGPCGLCALSKLKDIGVTSLKIVGREASPYRKLASVQLVSEMMKSLRAGMNEQELQEKAIRIRKTPEKCLSGYMCYYK